MTFNNKSNKKTYPCVSSSSSSSSSSSHHNIETSIQAMPLTEHIRKKLLRKNPNSELESNCFKEEEKQQQISVSNLLNRLTEQELEIAASASYEYAILVANTSTRTNTKDRNKYAAAMVQRYLSQTNSEEEALAKLKATCQFRKDMQIDILRLAFDPHRQSDNLLDVQKQLRRGLNSKMLYVCGYDREGRSTFIFEPHLVEFHDEQWTLRHHIYTLERAIATSKQQHAQVNAMIHFAGFSNRHVPPHSISKAFLSTLRHHYASHIHSIFLVDAPSAFVVFWTILKPLLGPFLTHRCKIHFVTGPKQKQKHIGKLYDDEQARPWMLPTGKKRRELNVTEYLDVLPFDRAFDDDR